MRKGQKTAKLTRSIHVLVKPGELSKIKRLANDDGRTVSGYVRHAVLKSMELTLP